MTNDWDYYQHIKVWLYILAFLLKIKTHEEINRQIKPQKTHHSIPLVKGQLERQKNSLPSYGVTRRRKGSNGYKLLKERFHPDIRNTFFAVRTIIWWNNVPRDVVESSSMEVFKLWLDRVLDNLIKGPFPMNIWIRQSFKVPSNLGCSII